VPPPPTHTHATARGGHKAAISSLWERVDTYLAGRVRGGLMGGREEGERGEDFLPPDCARELEEGGEADPYHLVPHACR
jgi:hypothetical protein